MDDQFINSGRMTWRRAFLVGGPWQLRDKDGMRATLTKGTVDDLDGQSWRFDPMFLTLTDESTGVIGVRAGRDAVVPSSSSTEIVTPSATYTMCHDLHAASIWIGHDEIATMFKRRYMQSWTIDLGERQLPMELIVFVMTAIERREQVARQFGRHDRRSVRNHLGHRDGLVQGPGCALGIVIAVVLVILVLLSYALTGAARL